MSKVFKLIVDESNEPLILEEDEVLEDILIRLESISNRIDDIQCSLIKNNDEDSSLDLDISEIDFQSIKKYGVSFTPYFVIIKIQETPSYFKLPFLIISPVYLTGAHQSILSFILVYFIIIELYRSLQCIFYLYNEHDLNNSSLSVH